MGKLQKIVICDDHVISQLGIKHALRDCLPNREFQFWSSFTGQGAIDLVKEHLPDLLTLDLCLPDMPGLDVLKCIRDAGYDTNVLMMALTKTSIGFYSPIHSTLMAVMANMLEKLMMRQFFSRTITQVWLAVL